VSGGRGWDGTFTFKEGGERPDIGSRCGDGIPLPSTYGAVVTDSNEQSLLVTRGVTGGYAVAGRHCDRGDKS